MLYGNYVAVARLKQDNSIVAAYAFDKKEDALNYIPKLQKECSDDSLVFIVEDKDYEHFKFWNRTRN